MDEKKWAEQKEIEMIEYFETLSLHKRHIIEAEIRSGKLSLMA